jgi:hypothetical protein
MFNVYILFYFFNFLKNVIKKYFFIIKYIIIFLFLFYFYWVINYLLLLLYKHYILYIPLFNIKENFRFLNFEWIDFRNYFNIVKLHNVLIDLNIHNNIFYNEIIKQLNFKLNNYNVKFTPNFNVSLFTHVDINKSNINKDTILLNNIFEKWNKYHGAKFLRRWKKYKRLLNWHLRHLYKGKNWYRSMRKEKVRGSNLDFFNTGRYFENSKNEISNNIGIWDNLHQVKKLPYSKEIKIQFQKTQSWYTYFKKRHTSKKRPRFVLSTYMKLKHIPFSHIYKELNMSLIESFKLKKLKEITFWFEKYFNKYKYVDKSIFFLKNWFINWKYFDWRSHNNKVFFFKKIYRDFLSEQRYLVFKTRIPSLLVTESRIQRFPPDPLLLNRYYQDHVSMGLTDEMSQFIYYKDLSKKGCIKNIIFKISYIYKKYPYKINKKNKYYVYAIKNYFNIIDSGIKIPKKFFFFERSKLRNFNKLGHRLLNKIDSVYCNQLLKYKYWDKVFYLKRLNKRNLDFWGFFDYLKANKFILSNEKIDDYFTTVFIERWKKDYYHMRVYLLRIIAFLHYYTYYKKIKINSNSTLLDWISDIKIEGAPVNLESLSTLNSLKFLNDMSNKTKIKDIMDDSSNTQEQEQINENLFYHFKYRWHIKELLNSGGIDSYGNKDKFMFIINLFYKKFNKYFVEYNKINKYNDKYKFKIKSYKVKVLRKIKNLKKFFFFNTKRNKGWRLFSYLNTFSIKYHIKHLLWHSPYSYFLFKKNNILKNEHLIKSLNYYYYYNRIKYNVINYSYIFNLFLNILDIKEDWAFYLTDNIEYSINSNVLNLTFYYVYNYGNFFYLYLNEIDFFRIFNSLLKTYYDNFLIKLTRYRYILELDDYTILNVIIRYFKQWYNSSYLKIRYFIYQIHETYVKYIKRKWLHFLRKKYWIRNRVDLIPFWFFFDYYIKCLIKYLFNKYFVKWHFIIWWLNYRLNYSFIFFFWLMIQKYKYYNLLFINKAYILAYIFRNIGIIINIYNYIYKHFILFFWYLNIIFNNFIFLVIKNYNIKMMGFLYKLILFNYYFYIKIMIINILNFITDLKYLLLFKFKIQDFIKYIFKYIQNIKNKIIFNKSNYYFFKKQKLIKKRKKHIPLYSFLSTNLKRNWFSLRSRTSNFFVFHNFYLLNISNIYIINKNYDLNDFLFIISNSIPLLNKKLLKMNISFLFLYYIYIIFFIIIFFINKKYFNIFFINKKYYVENLNLNIKIKKNRNVFNNISNFNKKNLFIYKFFLYKYSKYLNVLNIFYNKKYKWLKNFINYSKYLDNTSYDQFYINKPIYKTGLVFAKFVNLNRFNYNIKKYTTFFLNKKFPIVNFFNEYLMCYEFNFKKENIVFKYQNFTDNIYFNFVYFYWLILIPLFFFQYILIKFHLKANMKTKRRLIYILKASMDTLRLFVKINKYLGRSFFKSIYKSKRWRDPSHAFLNRKRVKRYHYTSNFLRYRKLYYRLSPLGSYYYWFSKINLVQYLISYKNYFFNTIIKSYYYMWLVLSYWLILFILIKKYYKYRYINKFKFIYIKKSN